MDITFAQRVDFITALTKALTCPDKTAASARAEAVAREKEIYATSSSPDAYHQACQELIGAESAIDKPINQTEYVAEIFNEDGPTLGKYKHATFHADGQTSTIFKARPIDTTLPNKVVALKVTTPSQQDPPHDSKREIRILQAAQHTNIIPLLDTFQQPGGKLILVFPFLHQDLENLLRTNTLTRAHKTLVYQGLFSALHHLHSHGIIHRDIKPLNILLHNNPPHLYLIDFGIAWSAHDPASEPFESKITDVGTTRYRPPELLFGHHAYTAALDIWAAGCVVAELIRPTHAPIFDAGPLGSDLSLIKSIFSTLGTPTDDTWPSARSYPDWNKVHFKDFPARPWSQVLPVSSAVAVDFLERTVCLEPEQRMTAAQALEHPLATCIDSLS